jgi:2-oxoglutarate dehydrogenase E2 component (dihydrolipoamide succinyltransferase)
MEATILKWHKNPGDAVAQDETVLEIATDKVDSEVPSTAAGTITEILFKENDVVPIGTVIARINTGGAATVEAAPTTLATPGVKEVEDIKVEEEIPYQPTSSPNAGTAPAMRFYSPLVLNIAASEGIGMAELEKIPGTGQDGRVSKKDILQYVANRGQVAQATTAPQAAVVHQPAPTNEVAPNQLTAAPAAPSYQPPVTYSGNVEVIEMDRMRKLIAKHMVDSKHTSAHVTSFAECDVTNLVLWRERMKKDFEKRENEKITFTPLFIEAIVKCIKKYPWLNSSVDGDKIIVKKDINIGMATALPTS